MTKLSNISFKEVVPGDPAISIIADWYLNEWNIPQENTCRRLENFPNEDVLYQVILKTNNVPVASGGLYNHVGILNDFPDLMEHRPWIALLYTIPGLRNKGIGSLLLKHLELAAKDMGFKKIYLFTFTAERLYLRMNWQPMQRVQYKGHDTVVMWKDLIAQH